MTEVIRPRPRVASENRVVRGCKRASKLVAGWVLAAIAVQSGLLAIVLLGFVYAAMRRQVTGLGDAGLGLRRLLWERAKLGVAGALTVGSVALIPGALWSFAWFAGWDNSFNKGYEQAAVGPLLGVLGVAVFMLSMPYVQLAQARHAVTGDWRTFYRVTSNLRIWAGAPMWAALLAVLLFVASLWLFALFAAPTFFSQGESYAGLTDAEVLDRLRLWYLVGGAVFVVLLFAVRRYAAAVYVRALRQACRVGFVDPAELTTEERRIARALDTPSRPRRRPLAHLALLYPLVAALWFGVVAQVFVAQFVNDHGPVGWLNQPLLLVPVVQRLP